MKWALLALAALAALLPLRMGESAATFVASSANPAASFATASDFNTVAVALSDPGAVLRGSVTLTATAASNRGIASVRFQRAGAGTSTWTDVCVDTVAPYTCAWNDADGLYDVRAVALDSAGYSRTATVTGRRIDNTAPATTLTDPGSPLTGAKTLSATASDAGSGVASVALQYRSGGEWTTICAQASCSWSTSALPDGLYDLRSLATDTAGNTSTSVVSNRRVDNRAPSIAVNSPATARGTITVSSTLDDGAGSGVASVRYQFRSGAGAWSDVCNATSAPFTCSADTAGVPDGVYDVRAIATDGVGLATTSATLSLRVDNTAPSSVALTDPGSPLSGSVTLTATAVDAGSGIASVRIERAPAGGSTWTEVCTDTAAPYSCAWSDADGLYDLRAVATDVAGNTRTSAVVASRRLDTAGPAVTLTDPGSPLRGSVTLNATATDPAGVASVTFQRKSSSGSTWTTICTDNAAPYTCAWSTSADGAYDLRATALDTLGRSTNSAVVASRQVDNTAPVASAVSAVNGSGTAGPDRRRRRAHLHLLRGDGGGLDPRRLERRGDQRQRARDRLGLERQAVDLGRGEHDAARDRR